MASLAYYHGQVVEEVVFGDEDWQWAIRMKGGAVIKNWDQRRTAPPDLPENTGLLTSIFSPDETKLQFGFVDPATQQVHVTEEVVFTPTQYSITDPVYAVEEEFPQRQTEAVVESPEVMYPEHLLAREADGPEHQEEITDGEVEAGTSPGTADDDDSEAGSQGA